MEVDEVRQYCLNKAGANESLPFGPDTLVIKVLHKAFALVSLDDPEVRVNLKCDPEIAIHYREAYPGQVLPGYHMNKRHWNTVLGRSGLPDRVIKQMIDQSYDLVREGLTRKDKKALDGLGPL